MTIRHRSTLPTAFYPVPIYPCIICLAESCYTSEFQCLEPRERDCATPIGKGYGGWYGSDRVRIRITMQVENLKPLTWRHKYQLYASGYGLALNSIPGIIRAIQGLVISCRGRHQPAKCRVLCSQSIVLTQARSLKCSRAASQLQMRLSVITIASFS
jgi:hypothetical protein